MSASLRPDSSAAELADIRRRLLVLETAQRTGLNRVKSARSVGHASPTTFGSWETGTGGTTWVDDDDSTLVGVGYPQVQCTVRSKVLIFVQAQITELSTDSTYRSRQVDFGITLDAVIPTSVPAPKMSRRVFNPRGPTGGVQQFPLGFFVKRADLSAGIHTFQVAALWEDTQPAAANDPLMSDITLLVLPVD